MTEPLPAAAAALRVEAFEAHDLEPRLRRLHRNRNAPVVVASILDALRLDPRARVLQIGTGSGYLAAVLGRLAGEVVSLERRPAAADAARARLARLGIANVQVIAGDGAAGWSAGAPYDAIVVSARAPRPPRHLVDQLAIGGRLIAFVGLFRARQRLVLIERIGADERREAAIGEVQLLAHLDEILVEIGALTREQAEAALRAALDAAQPIERVLRERYQLAERDLVRAVALQRGFAVGDIDALRDGLDPAIRARLAEPFARFNRVVAVRVAGDELVLATSNPDADFEGALRPFGEAHRVVIHLLGEADFERLWSAAPARGPAVLAEATGDVDLLGQPSHLGRFAELLRALLLEAVAEGASDLHFERYGGRVRVRLRVDGALYDSERVPLTVVDLLGIINVIKVQAGLDIADHNHPQGGRFRTHAGVEHFDLRVQTQPALDGEHCVVRLLSHRGAQRSIDGLGFPDAVARGYRRLLDSPQGLVLVVGPTGSGKTTTLYAGLQILAADVTRKVITVEDPIEYSIDGIQQTAARPTHGFDFADAVRVFVRQDPDAMLIGEIRDHATALEALRASQTGHLVLSTLHCNDAPDAVQRLVDLGMHENSIAAELIAVLAQRLARRVCRNCAVEAVPDPALLAEVFPEGPPPGFRASVGEGCPRCNGRGLAGRVAVGELLLPSPAFKRAVARRVPLDDLRAAALADGMVPLRERALALVTAGVIPLAELRRMLPPDRMAPAAAR